MSNVTQIIVTFPNSTTPERECTHSFGERKTTFAVNDYIRKNLPSAKLLRILNPK